MLCYYCYYLHNYQYYYFYSYCYCNYSRLVLFRDGESLISQITSRLRIVFCDVVSNNLTRRLLLIDKQGTYRPAIQDFEMDGSDDYDILLCDDRDRELGMQSSQSDDNNSEIVIAKDEVENGESNSADIRQARNRSPFDWAMYFDRSLVEEQKGNLMVSVTLSVKQSGFIVTTRDMRTRREAYRFVPFAEACSRGLVDMDLKTLYSELNNMDESLAFDLVDELISRVEVQDSGFSNSREEEGVGEEQDQDQEQNQQESMALVLAGEGEGEGEGEGLVLARLTPHRAADGEPRAKPKKTLPVYKVDIKLIGANDLSPVSAVLLRSLLRLFLVNYFQSALVLIAESIN